MKKKKRSKKEMNAYKMSKVRAANTGIENIMSKAISDAGLRGYRRNMRNVLGTPDFCWKGKKVAVFCDSKFWHGYNWNRAKKDIKVRKKFWFNKIKTNIDRDRKVNTRLRQEGWKILRFWDFEIKRNACLCAKKVAQVVEAPRK